MSNLTNMGLKGLKAGIIFGVSTSTTMVVKDIIKHNTPEQKKRLAKLSVNIVSMAVASYVTTEVVNHVEEKIEDTISEFNAIFKKKGGVVDEQREDNVEG